MFCTFWRVFCNENIVIRPINHFYGKKLFEKLGNLNKSYYFANSKIRKTMFNNILIIRIVTVKSPAWGGGLNQYVRGLSGRFATPSVEEVNLMSNLMSVGI